MAKLKELFGIDTRSLALFRIGLGLIILGELLTRSADLTAFYTDSGVLPRSLLLENYPYWGFSLHLLGGSAAFQASLFILTGIFALALIFGYRTRIATFACWILMLSLHVRNPLIRQAGDTLLHLYLFWGLFLPLGAQYSMDRALDSSGQKFPTRIVSGGSIALLLQICFVYWFTSANKTGEAWRDGSALYYVFNLDTLTTPVGRYLLSYPSLLTFLSYFTVWLERLGPLFAFVPVFNGAIRILLVALFIGFHLGIGICLYLGPFPFISIIGWFVFLPSIFWERMIEPRDWPPEIARLFREWWLSLATRLRQRPLRIKAHWFSNVVALLLITYVFLLNLHTVHVVKYQLNLPKKFIVPADILGLIQTWYMFAPFPPREEGWYVIPGRLQDGSVVDVFRDEKLQWEKPQSVAADISNERWRKYLEWLSIKYNTQYLPYYASYLCWEWNSRHTAGKQLVSLQVYFMREKTLPGGRQGEPVKVLFWEGSCLAGSKEGSRR